MYFHSLTDFLNMGSYAGYVWSAYGITFLVLLWNILRPWLKIRKLKKER